MAKWTLVAKLGKQPLVAKMAKRPPVAKMAKRPLVANIPKQPVVAKVVGWIFAAFSSSVIFGITREERAALSLKFFFIAICNKNARENVTKLQKVHEFPYVLV